MRAHVYVEKSICRCLVVELYLTLRNPMDCSTPGFLVLHPLPEFAQTQSTESVMPCNLLIFCFPFLLSPSIFPSIRVFSSQSVLRIRWPLFLRGNYYLHSLFYPLLNTEIVKYTLHWTLGIHDSLSLKRLTIHGRRRKQMFINTKLVSKHNELNLTVGIMTLITLEFLDFSEIPAKCRAGAVLLLPQLKNEC